MISQRAGTRLASLRPNLPQIKHSPCESLGEGFDGFGGGGGPRLNGLFREAKAKSAIFLQKQGISVGVLSQIVDTSRSLTSGMKVTFRSEPGNWAADDLLMRVSMA